MEEKIPIDKKKIWKDEFFSIDEILQMEREVLGYNTITKKEWLKMVEEDEKRRMANTNEEM